MRQLRPYQTQGIGDARVAFNEGARAVLIVSPTGSGKSTIGAEIARLASGRGPVLWLAHRSELIDQAADTIRATGQRVGVISASSDQPFDITAPVQVASVQTLLARGVAPTASLVVIDEAHHCTAAGYLRFLSAYPLAKIVGLTATPERRDGVGLGEVFNRMVVVTTPKELVEQGYLVPCEVIAPSKTLRSNQIAARPVDAWRKHAAGRSTIVFSPNIDAALEHTAQFEGEARMIDGETPADERREALTAFKTGTLKVLVNVGVLIEGTDLPICSCIVLARGCTTEGTYLQMVGRMLRPHATKTDAILIDLRGVSHIHGHPLETRKYSLEGRGISHGEASIYYPTCRVCAAPLLVTGDPCPDCGAGPKEQVVTVSNDPLVKYAAARRLDKGEREARLINAIRDAQARGVKPWSVFFRYKTPYGIDAAYFKTLIRRAA